MVVYDDNTKLDIHNQDAQEKSRKSKTSSEYGEDEEGKGDTKYNRRESGSEEFGHLR